MENNSNGNINFTSLALAPQILKAVSQKGYSNPTPIQAQAIPPILEGRDVMAAAQTGTGKTAGFTLPILHRLSQGPKASNKQVRALILTPTRELAAQIEQSVKDYGKGLPLSSAVVFGGVNIGPQIQKLRLGADILIATPGRLLDLFERGAINFNKLEVLVLDEADRMLDMGFIHDIKRVIKLLPAKRQNLLFSATFSEAIRTLAKGFVNNPVEVVTTVRNSTVETIKQVIHPVSKNLKSKLLIKLIQEKNWKQVLVFSRTKHGANKLVKVLEKENINSAAIHGNKSQTARTKALLDFKKGTTRILVATDIAARGLDIHQLPQVVNFDLPSVPEDYVHRIGRTGRAGGVGFAASLVSPDESKQLSDIENLIRKKISAEIIPGFEPSKNSDKEEVLSKHSQTSRNSLRNKPSRSGRPFQRFSTEEKNREPEASRPTRRNRKLRSVLTFSNKDSGNEIKEPASNEPFGRTRSKFRKHKGFKSKNKGLNKNPSLATA